MRSVRLSDGGWLTIAAISKPLYTVTICCFAPRMVRKLLVVCSETDMIKFGNDTLIFSTQYARMPFIPRYFFQYSLPQTSCHVTIIFLRFSRQTIFMLKSTR